MYVCHSSTHYAHRQHLVIDISVVVHEALDHLIEHYITCLWQGFNQTSYCHAHCYDVISATVLLFCTEGQTLPTSEKAVQTDGDMRTTGMILCIVNYMYHIFTAMLFSPFGYIYQLTFPCPYGMPFVHAIPFNG